jgi:hypothetical protein
MSRSINGIALLPFTTALTTVRKNATKVHLRPEIRSFGCRVIGGVCCEFGIELYTSKAPDVRPGHQAAHSRRVANEGARARRKASAELWGMVVFRPIPPLRTLPRGRYHSPHDVPLALPVDPVWHLHLDLRRLARPGLPAAVRPEHIHQGASERGRRFIVVDSASIAVVRRYRDGQISTNGELVCIARKALGLLFYREIVLYRLHAGDLPDCP